MIITPVILGSGDLEESIVIRGMSHISTEGETVESGTGEPAGYRPEPNHAGGLPERGEGQGRRFGYCAFEAV